MTGGLIAENLLKNTDFSEISRGLPAYWEFRGPNLEGWEVKGDVVKIGGGDEPSGVYLIQQGLALAGGARYTLSYKARSNKDSQYRVYCEWTKDNNGKVDWLSSQTTFASTSTEWQSLTVIFEYGEGASPVHFVIQVQGEGEAEFKDLHLECSVPELESPAKSNSLGDSKLLINGDFAIRDANNPLFGWEARGEKGAFSYKGGGVLMKGGDGSGLTLVQRDLALQAETSYEVLYEVRGGKGGEYRVYYEAIQVIDGKDVWKSFATEWHKTSDQWETNGFTFTFPDKVRSSHLVFDVKSGADVEFRKITLNAVDEKNGKKQLGGVWQLYRGSRFSQVSDGNEMLFVKPNSPNAGAILKGVPLEAGRKYTLRYSVRGEGDAGNSTGFHPFQLRVKFDGIAETADSSWDDTWNNNFQNKQFSFVVPAKAASGKVDIECFVSSKGCVIYDNIALSETKENPAEKYIITLDSPCYRNMIFSSMPVPEIAGSIVTDLSVNQVNLILKNGETIIYSAELKTKGASVYFKIPAADLPVGKYRLTAELINKTGIVATPHLDIEKLNPAAMEVVQGKDRNFYINGKVFFPIMFWNMVSYGKDEKTKGETLYYAARQGVNVIQRFAADEANILRILDEIGKQGVKLSLEVIYSEYSDGDQLKLWIHHLSNILTPAVRNHPALLCYFLADEPSWTGVPAKNLIASYQALKALDPYHPIYINAAPRGSVDEHKVYSQAADIYGNDIYPVPYPSHHSALVDKGLASVGKYAQRMSEAAGGRKPIWMALQGFSWTYVDNNNTKDRLKGTGYPTYIESRFMAYDALVNNANSVSFWGTVFVYTPSFYDVLFSITRELHEMSGLLTRGEIVNDVTSTNKSIICRAINFGGKKYLIALNNSDQPVTSEISGRFSGSELQVFKEDRTVAVGIGKFSDRFKPFEVHVYGEANLPPSVNELPPPNPELDKKENPFHKYIDLKLHAVMYEGKANWIWEKENTQVVSSKVWLGREFTIDKPIESARLLIAADNLATAYFNGNQLGKVANWSIIEMFDCTSLVHQGSNLLSIAAADAGGLPCGVLADLEIKTTDGETISIVSDATWQATAKVTDDWLTPAAVQKWSPAAIVAPYGGGAWGKNVQLPQD